MNQNISIISINLLFLSCLVISSESYTHRDVQEEHTMFLLIGTLLGTQTREDTEKVQKLKREKETIDQQSKRIYMIKNRTGLAKL